MISTSRHHGNSNCRSVQKSLSQPPNQANQTGTSNCRNPEKLIVAKHQAFFPGTIIGKLIVLQMLDRAPHDARVGSLPGTAVDEDRDLL